MDPQITVESCKQVLGKVFSGVSGVGVTQSLSELVNRGLCYKCKGGAGVTDVEIKGSGAAPSHLLF